MRENLPDCFGAAWRAVVPHPADAGGANDGQPGRLAAAF